MELTSAGLSKAWFLNEMRETNTIKEDKFFIPLELGWGGLVEKFKKNIISFLENDKRSFEQIASGHHSKDAFLREIESGVRGCLPLERIMLRCNELFHANYSLQDYADMAKIFADSYSSYLKVHYLALHIDSFVKIINEHPNAESEQLFKIFLFEIENIALELGITAEDFALFMRDRLNINQKDL
ncbi:MAG: hypothetical protein A3F91_09660 [Flavobacteria bacterium RIFCSPLOWO2_12_FULL_35_11]|nr:MAG: hypothetical protein A3F91_09660 [Flavobacteria bacterium RIFCSPLOWO2_12_FULL_35_11]